MSVSSEVRKAGPFLGNGTAASFPFGFKVFEADDVKVVQADAGGVETTLTPGVDYSVTLNPEQESAPGGSVLLNTPLPDGERLAITSSMANLQPITLTNQGGFYPGIINAGLDRLTILVQQIAEQVGRAVKANISSGQDPDELMRELLDGIRQAIDSAALAATSSGSALKSKTAAASSATAAAESARQAAESAATASAPIDAHEAKPNPHPQYADLANSTGNLDLTGSRKMISTLSSSARIVTDLVQYRGGASEVGAIAFVAPSGSSIMTALEIASFEYGGGNKPKHMHLAVQFYRSGTVDSFQRTSLRSTGAYTPAVRIGVKKGTNRPAVLIGNVDEVWGYLHLVVTKAILGHSKLTDEVCTGWTSELVTSLDDFEHVVELNDPLSGPDPHPQYAMDSRLTVSVASPAGGVDGDLWFQP